MPFDVKRLLELAKGEGAEEQIAALVQGAVDSEVGGLKQKNAELLGTLDKYKPYKELGDLETLKGLLAKVPQLETALAAAKSGLDEGKLKEEADKLAQATIAGWSKEADAKLAAETEKLAKTKEALTATKQKLFQERVTNRLAVACRDAKTGEDLVPLDAFPFLVQKLLPAFHEEDDGEITLKVSGVTLKDPDGKALTDRGLVEALRSSYGDQFWNSGGQWFFYNKASGTGETNGARRTTFTGTKKRSEMSPKEKSAFVAEHGQEAFHQLPA